MSERRPHWDDDLIVAVGDAIEHADPTVHPTVGMVNDVIAAVEDWVYDNFQGGEYDNPVEYTPEELAIQRVREVCADQCFWAEHGPDAGLANAVTVESIFDALEKGDNDE